MIRKLLLSLLAGITAASSGVLSAADTPNAANSNEARLREALRGMQSQVQSAVNERDTLKAENAEQQAKIDGLTKQVQEVTKRLADEKDASDKTIQELKKHESEQEASITALQQQLSTTVDEYKKLADKARTIDAQRAKLADKAILLQRRVDDREAKNLELYKTGNEILTRYAKFTMGEAMLAREPFTGITRVKLKTLVQDYEDKLQDHVIRPGDEFSANPKIQPNSPAQQKASPQPQQKTKAEPSPTPKTERKSAS